MKRLVVILALVTAAMMVAASASAAKPDRFFLPAIDDIDLSGTCAFPVTGHVLENNEYGIAFEDGKVLVTGKFKVRLTNESTQKSIDVNISGPGVYRFPEDGSMEITAMGNWLFWFFPGDLGAGSPGKLLLTSGLATETIDASGSIASFTPPRKVTDACALLS